VAGVTGVAPTLTTRERPARGIEICWQMLLACSLGVAAGGNLVTVACRAGCGRRLLVPEE
jgi:hypothetical protein